MSTKRSIPNRIAIAGFAALVIASTVYLYGSPVEATAPFDPHTNLLVPAGLPEDGWTGGPRECELANGITTECVFPD